MSPGSEERAGQQHSLLTIPLKPLPHGSITRLSPYLSELRAAIVVPMVGPNGIAVPGNGSRKSGGAGVKGVSLLVGSQIEGGTVPISDPKQESSRIGPGSGSILLALLLIQTQPESWALWNLNASSHDGN